MEIQKTNSNIKSLLLSDGFKSSVGECISSHLRPDRFVRMAVTALARTPKLSECTQQSLLRCLLDLSSMGLEPDGRLAHLIPYKDQCTLIVDWKGLVAIAKRSGDVLSWRAEVVCENDYFSWLNGCTDHRIDFSADRGKPVAVYSIAKLSNGETETEVMTMDEVKAIQMRSRSSQSGPWQTDFLEMARKTVIRRHSKRLCFSSEFSAALEADEETRTEKPAKKSVRLPELEAVEVESKPEE